MKKHIFLALALLMAVGMNAEPIVRIVGTNAHDEAFATDQVRKLVLTSTEVEVMNDEGWYTLSMDEWEYLFCGRTDAAHLFGMGSVNGINGTILLPDNWTGDKFTDTENGLADRGTSYENIYGTNFSFHTYTAEQWETMEANGAVFLPAAGRCYRMDVSNVGSYGSYWSATPSDEIDAWYMYFNLGILDPHGNNYREYGRSVRLVR